MIVNFEKVGFRYKRLIKKIFNRAEEVTNNKFDNVVVTVSFANEEQIHNLNKEYRDVDRATDVLSFPMLDKNYKQNISLFKDDVSPDGNLYLGDIVICKTVAKRQAKQYKHSLKREISFLALHGLLHLYGYDHIEKEDEVVMMSTAENVLNSLNIKRKTDKKDV